MGFRHVKDLVDEQADPIDGIVDRYHLRIPVSAQATVSQRVEDLSNEVMQSNAKPLFSTFMKNMMRSPGITLLSAKL